MNPTITTNEQPTYRHYVSSFSPYQKASKALHIFATTVGGASIGAGSGAGLGSVVPAVGTGLGTGVGGATGLGVGIVTSQTYDFVNYKKWLKKNKQIDILEKVMEMTESKKELFCPITLTLPIIPVSTPHSPHIYDKDALENWINHCETCPVTRKPLSKKDVKVNIGALGKMKHSCHIVLKENTGKNHREPENADFTDNEIEGVKALYKDLDIQVKTTFKKQYDDLYKKVQNDEISMMEFASEMQELANALEIAEE